MFNLKGEATFSGIAVSRSGGDDAAVFATMVIEVADQASDVAAAVLGAEHSLDVDVSFHNVEEPNDRKFFGIASIASTAQFRNRHALTLPGFANVRVKSVKKVQLTPTAGCRWNVKCSLLIESPPSGLLEIASELIHESVRIELVQDAELFDADAATEADKAFGKKIADGIAEATGGKVRCFR